jgi:hypothetical protein
MVAKWLGLLTLTANDSWFGLLKGGSEGRRIGFLKKEGTEE